MHLSRGSGDFGRGRGGRGGFDRGGRGGGSGRGGYSGGRGGFSQSSDKRNVAMPTSNPTTIKKVNFKPGTSGRALSLITNFFPLSVTGNEAHQYELDIRPIDTRRHDNPKEGGDIPVKERSAEEKEEASRRLNKFVDRQAQEILKKFLSKVPSFSRDEAYAFDGSKIVYFTKQVTGTHTQTIEQSVNGRAISFSVALTYIKKIDLSDVKKYYENQSEDIPENVLSFFEIAIKESFKSKYANFQGKNFDMNSVHSKDGIDDIEFVNGFKSVVTQTQAGLALNVHLKTTCILNSKYTNLQQFLTQKLGNKDKYSNENLSEINSLIRHLEVETRHGNVTRTYKIDKLITTKPSEHKIDDKTSIADYFKSKYNISVNPNLPLLKVQLRKETLLPVEVCFFKSKQFLSNQKITPFVQRELLLKSTNAPNVYFTKLEKVIENISSQECSSLQQRFGINIEKTPMQIQGRVLATPNVKGARNNDAFPVPAKPTKFSVFNLDPHVNQRDLQNFATQVRSTAERYGLRLAVSQVVSTTATSLPAIRGLLDNVCKKCKNEIILIGIPKANSGIRSSELYNHLKFYSERVFTFMTQCFQSQYVLNPPRGYFDNLMLKINGKLGGQNSVVDSSSFKNFGFDPSKTMVIAYDVNHPAVGEVSNKSIAAVVGSMDPIFSLYHSVLAAQTRTRTEMVSHLEDHVKILFEDFKKKNTKYPEVIFVFRDGVSEGQFADVKRIEIESIDSSMKKLGFEAKIIFFVVQKIHSGRFAMTTADTSARNPTYNIPSGTVVDTAIVSSKHPNFYLNSHFSPLGTSKPTHYYVLRNDLNMAMDLLENFVFRCCFSCIRTRLPLSIPLAVRYADLAAYRGKLWFEAALHTADPQLKGIPLEDKITVPKAMSPTFFYC